MNHMVFRNLAVFSLLAALALPATALEWRSGNIITIGSLEVVDDDLYFAGKNITIDGRVQGDVVAFAQTVTINGSIEGSLFVAAQDVVVRGAINGSLRGGANMIYVGDKATIARDLLAASESLELAKGSRIGRDIVYAGAEVTIAGELVRHARIAAQGLHISGSIGGNVLAKVGEHSDGAHTRMHWFLDKSSVETASVPAGISIDKDARIKGNLTYEQSKDLTFPAGTVLGTITRTAPHLEVSDKGFGSWALDFLRMTLALLLVGVLLLLLFRRPLETASQMLRSHPGRSLGLGAAALGIFVGSILALTIGAVLLAILFGYLSLSSLSVTAILGGLVGNAALIFLFVFIAVFVTKLIVGMTIGKWLLAKTGSHLANSRFAPLLVGVPLLMIVLALVSIPGVPGFLSGLFSLVLVLFGLGALWLWLKSRAIVRP